MTQDDKGRNNAVLYFFFNAFANDPPIVVIGIGGRPEGGDKDTLVNIRQSQEFAVIFGGNLFLGGGVLLWGLCFGLLPHEWLLAGLPGLAGLAGAALVSAIGGPMQDITVATRPQTQLAVSDIAAGTRAFVVVNQAGLLVGLLASPILFSILGVAATVMLCGLCVLAVSAIGLWRFSGTIED